MILYPLLFFAAYWIVRRTLRARSPLQNVPGPSSASFLTGNVLQLMDRQGWSFHRELGRKYGPVVKLNWIFNTPLIYIFDPVALQHILKDIVTYDEPPWYLQSNDIMLGPGVLAVTGHGSHERAQGETHRKQRKILTPAFAPRHLRALVPLCYSVVNRLVDALDSRTSADGADVDVLGWMGRTALELIGQCGLGHSFDPLTEDVPDAFAAAVKNFAPVATSPEMILLRQIVPFVKDLGPRWLRRFIVERLPIPCVRRMIEISDTMHEGALKLFTAKKAAIEAGHSTDAKDIMSLLLQANMAASEEERLPDDELIGQMSSIILAAMDTTSNAMSRTLHLLAQHSEVQAKLRREIQEARATHGAHMSFDQIHALPFLDAVCRETLRLYPPAAQAFRQTTRDSVVPLSQPIRGTDGTLMTSLPVPRGTNIFVAIMACNCNEALWGPDALEWKPERWLAPLPAAVEDAAIPGIYTNLVTFLAGGRSCVGFMFSQLEMKSVLSALIANFTFELSEKPVVWNFTGVSYPSVGTDSMKPELWLKIRKVRED
ncbi:cytochrome P450 [Trametes polyzona]|nr:cytochrome P450 [Trametes polyzona]